MGGGQSSLGDWQAPLAGMERGERGRGGEGVSKYISFVDEQWNVMKRVGVGSGERELSAPEATPQCHWLYKHYRG